MAERVDLNDEIEREAFVAPHLDERSNIGSQFLLRARLSSVMKKRLTPARDWRE